jgi:hypothetical protein
MYPPPTLQTSWVKPERCLTQDVRKLRWRHTITIPLYHSDSDSAVGVDVPSSHQRCLFLYSASCTSSLGTPVKNCVVHTWHESGCQRRVLICCYAMRSDILTSQFGQRGWCGLTATQSRLHPTTVSRRSLSSSYKPRQPSCSVLTCLELYEGVPRVPIK